MIKRSIKFFIIILLMFVLSVLYLSLVGIETEKFNERITNKILKINKKINLDLKKVKFLLDPLNFTVNVVTQEPIILLEGKKLGIKEIKTNISLKLLILDQFSIDDLQISTKQIKLNDLILLARSFKNLTELFLLDRIIKEGFLSADIKLNFDNNGKIKNDYLIDGFIKDANINFFNKLNLKNLDFKFNINKEKYSLIEIKADFNDIKLSSPYIKIVEKKNLFLINGEILTAVREFNTKELNLMFNNLLQKLNIKNTQFSSTNNFSFNINKKLKINDLNIESKINLEQLNLKNKFINTKSYLPSLNELINFVSHKIIINYNKDKLKIKGNGKILIGEKPDFINYEIKKNDNKFVFDIKTDLKNSELKIDFLDYKKDKDLDVLILVKGGFKKNNQIKFDQISLTEHSNKIFFKNLLLSKDFKIISMDSFNFDYLNNVKIKNRLFLKKDKSNYIIKGVNFDATRLINIIMDSDDENSSLFKDFNSKINLNIDKTYIDKVNFINNLSGTLRFKNDKISNLDLKSTFPNNKIINFSIKTNNQQEKITRLFTNYPSPLVKRYDFIKGFEEGTLDFYSLKKNGTSNSLLIIDNFKVKEVPLFAKLLSLASLQGMADLLTGEGIRFTDLEMKFSKKKKLTTIEEMYAIGPAVSILMDGYIESKKLVSFRGTLVPATTINRTIASIPLLGNILVGKKTGEGVFGVSFKIKGDPKELKTTVNPVKTLTPRFITRTLEKIKKN